MWMQWLAVITSGAAFVIGGGDTAVACKKAKFDEVKTKCSEKCDEDMNDESESDESVDADGTPWVRIIGSGTTTMDVLKETT
mmetsp:Transcript_27490/g.45027  ORF Transcript_27490/g.45027 Transcript_27490/m.45027 type:complete len:82 (+) Transcript_27490:53-298(+)